MQISMNLRGLLLGTILTVAAPAFAQLSPVEQKLADAVKTRSPAAMLLLEKAVNINSGTLNQEGVREVGKLFRSELDALGFATRWVEMPAAMQRAGHLVATRLAKTANTGKRLLLLGHLDTVFEKDSAVQLWAPKDNRIFGQGVSDMKGGNVVMLEALRALHATGAIDDMTISIMFTGDEERVGRPVEKARESMIALAKQSDVALSFENILREAGGAEFVAVARRASSSWALDVTARQGHSSGVFGVVAGYGAAFEAARIVNTFREELMEPGLTFSPGLVLIGTEVNYDETQARASVAGKNNIIPPLATIRGDLRYLNTEQRDRVHARMRDIVGRNLPGTSATISFRESYPPMPPTEGNMALQRLYSEISVAAGYGKVDASHPSVRGAGDIQFVASMLDSLDALGAAGGGAHSPNEFLYPDSIERGAVRAAILMHRLGHR